MSLIAYHGDSKIKTKYLRRVRAHAKADQIIKGTYWENGKGCAVGCTLHGDRHKDYETELGIPEWLAFLEDSVFENLPLTEAKRFPERFLAAIRPGADLSMVKHRFLHWLLVDPEDGVIRFADDRGKTVIKQVAALHFQVLEGKVISDAARAAAGAAAWDAAGAARAARAAAWAAAWAAAGAVHYTKMAEKLLELLAAA